MAVISADGYRVTDLDGRLAPVELHTIAWDPVSAVKGEYRHFMQKEIFEQPRALIDTLGGRVNFETGAVVLPEMNLTPDLVARIDKLFVVACGTSYYAGLVGKYLIETLARLPVEVEYASEFRYYYNPIVDERTAVLTITQSGETADTLAAAEQARSQGATLWSIVNAIGSQSMRLSDGHIAMHAGPEIGVASTKAFTTSLADLYLLACAWDGAGTLVAGRQRQLAADVAHLPALVGRALERDAEYQALAERFHRARNFLFLGRGINYPIALEGALKLKEISYIHAEGYPAGEMKHGPIALIDEAMPVLAIVTKDALYDKMISQVQQAKARGGVVIALATEGDELIRSEADTVIYVPAAPPLLAPIVNVVPLQLLSYHIAVRRGADVDQPRNLAKSVTVE
jgi:glucosamine--fructose-6-phosphate aminotransferase (isomerizing)